MTRWHDIYDLSDDLTLNIGILPNDFMYCEFISKEEGTLTLVTEEVKALIKALDDFQSIHKEENKDDVI